jgi:hypothetical protein
VGERVEHHHRIAGLGELPERLAALPPGVAAPAATSSSR